MNQMTGKTAKKVDEGTEVALHSEAFGSSSSVQTAER